MRIAYLLLNGTSTLDPDAAISTRLEVARECSTIACLDRRSGGLPSPRSARIAAGLRRNAASRAPYYAPAPWAPTPARSRAPLPGVQRIPRRRAWGTGPRDGLLTKRWTCLDRTSRGRASLVCRPPGPEAQSPRVDLDSKTLAPRHRVGGSRRHRPRRRAGPAEIAREWPSSSARACARAGERHFWHGVALARKERHPHEPFQDALERCVP